MEEPTPVSPKMKTGSESTDQPAATGHSSMPHTSSVEAVEPMAVADIALARDELPRENEMTESDLQVQEEVVSVVQNEQVTDQMEVDFEPYFQAPKPPRRVSLLEYKERMKGKKRYPSEGTPDLEAITIPQAKELRVIKPLTEEGDKSDSVMNVEEDEAVKTKSPDVQKAEPTVITPVSQGTNSLASPSPQPVTVDAKMDDSKAEICPQDSEKHSSPVSGKALTPNATQPKENYEPTSIQWPSDNIRETRKDQLSATVGGITQMTSVEKRKQSLIEMPGGGRLEREREEKEKLWKEEEKKWNEEEEQKKEEEEREKERKREEKDLEDEKRKTRDKDPEVQELRKEKGRETNLTGKAIDVATKTGETWKSSSGHSDPRLPSHTIPSGHQAYNIPIHAPTKPPRFHSHRLPLTHHNVPLPQPPPPQAFLGFPHPPFPAPFNPPPPPPPPPQTDVWNMFGNIFAQHNLFPTEEPPPPPPRSPSPPPLPPLRFSSSRQMSPRRSPPPHRISSPHLSPPSRHSPMPMSPRSPSHSPERLPFRSRTKSRSKSPVKPLILDPKPRQLDAKQFRIISELVKKTAVNKCDASVQVVPPRMVSEGTQDGRGFKLCNTATQVETKTHDMSTLTDIQPKLTHR